MALAALGRITVEQALEPGARCQEKEREQREPQCDSVEQRLGMQERLGSPKADITARAAHLGAQP